MVISWEINTDKEEAEREVRKINNERENSPKAGNIRGKRCALLSCSLFLLSLSEEERMKERPRENERVIRGKLDRQTDIEKYMSERDQKR